MDIERRFSLVESPSLLAGAPDDWKKVTDPNAMSDERPYSDATANACMPWTRKPNAKLIVDQAYQPTLNLLMDRKED
jgi:hypothetical protein